MALALHAGQIVLADWRDGFPKEANKIRPAVVVEDEELFVPRQPTVILVPLTSDATVILRDLAVALLPTKENGCPVPCWALSHMVTATSKARVTVTPSCVTPEQLAAIRQQIALAVGALP
jgi:mRNA-degrading endonuclease toxin of MazEF toxin-antitoxin module